MDRVDLTELEALHRAAAKATAALDAATRNALPALLARLRALEEVARAAEDMLRGRECDQRHGRWSECDGALDAALRAALAAAKEGA